MVNQVLPLRSSVLPHAAECLSVGWIDRHCLSAVLNRLLVLPKRSVRSCSVPVVDSVVRIQFNSLRVCLNGFLCLGVTEERVSFVLLLLSLLLSDGLRLLLFLLKAASGLLFSLLVLG